MSTVQKIGIAFAVILVAAFLAYTATQEGGFHALQLKLRTVPSVTPVASSSVPVTSVQPPATVVPTKTPVQPSATPANSAEVSALLSAMNSQRARVGAAPLAVDGVLQSLAQRHAADMIARGYFDHTSPSGVTFQQRIEASGYSGLNTAENLGLTSGAVTEIVDGWMGSDGHRLNMLNDAYTEVGIGVAHGPWQGFSAVFAVAVFGNAK